MGFAKWSGAGPGPQVPAKYPVMDKKFYFTGKIFSENFFSENTLSELARFDCTRKTLFRWSEMRYKKISHTLGVEFVIMYFVMYFFPILWVQNWQIAYYLPPLVRGHEFGTIRAARFCRAAH